MAAHRDSRPPCRPVFAVAIASIRCQHEVPSLNFFFGEHLIERLGVGNSSRRFCPR